MTRATKTWDDASYDLNTQQRTCVQFESSKNTHGDHWTSTLKVQVPQEIKLKQGDDAIISKGDKCMWLKTIRGRDFQRRGISLCLFLSLFFSFSMNTYTLRDSWQSIDIRGDEVGVLRKHKHAGERRGKVTSEAYHSHRREWGEEGGKGRSLCSMIYGSSSALSIWIAELVSELWQCFYQAYRTEKAQ